MKGRPNPKLRRKAGNEGKVRGPSRAAFPGPAPKTAPIGHSHRPCGEPGCTADGIVGIGSSPVWLCLAHFDARMRGIGAQVRQLANALHVSEREP